MTITRLDLLPFIVVAFVVFALIYVKTNYSFFKWVKMHWFYRQSLSSKISTIFYLTGIALLLISLLDFRGKELKIKSNIPNQKTIVLIDSSSSMLVEDVRPNRFQKSLLLARHFVKSAAGQQVSIILFSDYQKTFVPFTSDVDLLDARISGLSSLNITKGGSNLSQAIQESIQYFKDTSEDSKLISGNILVFTDSEETAGGFDLNVPDGVSVGVVGVGTAKGGPIPMRDSRNVFYGNKQYEGQEVISKLDESFLKILATKIKNYKYWVATSFALPTDEILQFFTQVHNKRFSQGDIKIRPVMMEWVLIPALVLFTLGILLKMRPSFIWGIILCFSLNNYAQDDKEEKAPPPLDEADKKLISRMASGKASKDEKLTLAQSLIKKERFDSARILFKENLDNNSDPKYWRSWVNYGTTLLKLEEKNEALKIYGALSEKLKKIPGEESSILLKTIRTNTLLAFNNENKDKKSQDQKDQDQKKNESEQNQDEKNKENNQDEKNQRDSKNQKNNQNDKKDQKKKDDKSESEKNKDKDQKKDRSPEEEKSDQEKQKNDGDKNDQEKEQEKPEKKLKVKLPAQLKQLMQDDRALQEQLLDTSTNEKGKSNKLKDW